MAIVRLNPWNLSQILDDNNMWNPQTWEENGSIDLYETDQDVVVKAQLPGFDEEDIKIMIEGSTLTIRAETKEEVEDQKKKYYRKEIKSQSVVRSITLPAAVSSDDTKAQFKNGMLTLTLPKAEEAKPKEISLKSLTK